jgi:hypothetical protein
MAECADNVMMTAVKSLELPRVWASDTKAEHLNGASGRLTPACRPQIDYKHRMYNQVYRRQLGGIYYQAYCLKMIAW